MAQQQDAIQELYVSFFGRPGDTAGLKYWIDQVSSGKLTLSDIATSFEKSAESQNLFNGKSSGDFVENVYQNVLGRLSDTGGKAYWTKQLDAGNVTKSDLVKTILSSLKDGNKTVDTSTDLATLTNRVLAANQFNQVVSDTNHTSDYTGNAIAAARNWLSTVNSDKASLEGTLKTIQPLVSAFSDGKVIGKVINDGYIANADVFIDANNNGKIDPGEPSVKSDSSGNYFFPVGVGTNFGVVVASGGTNISTGQSFSGILKAPIGATIISPLTNLAQSLMETGAAKSIMDAQNIVFKTLDAPNVNLSTYNPVAAALTGTASEKADAVRFQAIDANVVNMMNSGTASFQGAGATLQEAQNAVLKAITSKLVTSSGGVGSPKISFSDPALIKDIMSQAASGAQLSSDIKAKVGASIDAVSKVVSEMNTLATKSASDFASGKIADPISAMTDIAKIQTLVSTDVIAQVQKATSAGNVDALLNQYTGGSLDHTLANVVPGAIDPSIHLPVPPPTGFPVPVPPPTGVPIPVPPPTGIPVTVTPPTGVPVTFTPPSGKPSFAMQSIDLDHVHVVGSTVLTDGHYAWS